MRRSRQAPRRGSHHTPRGGRRTNFVASPFDDKPHRSHNGFTLDEEARNTERHHDFWNTDKRLRDSKVSFVSAGTLEHPKKKDAESAMADMTLESGEDPYEEVFAQVEEMKEGFQRGPGKPVLEDEAPMSDDSSDNPVCFIVDTEGSGPVHTGLPAPQIRASSPTPSNSSDEVILFKGRNHQGKGIPYPPPSIKAPIEILDHRIQVVEERIQEQHALLEEVLHKHSGSSSPPQGVSMSISEDEIRLADLGPKPKKSRDWRNNSESPTDSLIADYIANMDEEDLEEFHSFGNRDLAGTLDDNIWQQQGNEASYIPPYRGLGWDRADICDFDTLSTSDGVMGEVQYIISKRYRPSGLQYLVVWDLQTVDEARWVPSTTLTSKVALAHIEKFEAEEELVPHYTGSAGSSESGDTDSDENVIELEIEDRVEQETRTKYMSDEQIARLLSKQEELGMGSAKVLLFDDDGDVDEDDDILCRNSNFTPVLSSKRKAKARGSKRVEEVFPSATMLAHAYDGFDVMDFDRPSLKKKPKGRKGKMPFDISDSELEASMEMARENDRLKKKARKQGREELRAQGLLGRKGGKPDLKQKYKEGMGIFAVKEEIKAFLMGADTTLALPPMGKADRKVVHELANAFKLKSKSVGHGDNRSPILYRTQRTSHFHEQIFNSIESRLSRKFLPRMDASGKGTGANSRGGGFNRAAVSYRDGDIVGGTAPELGAENRGRAMLEKMGWSSGTALGAHNNKGILQPVSHVVKTTKAGLG